MTYNQYPDFKNQYGQQQPYYGGAGMGPVYGQQQQPVTPPVQTGGPMFPTTGTTGTQAPQIPGMLPLEQSYIENILRLNKGKLTTVHAIFDTGGTNGAMTKDFTGIIEAAGRDHLILSDPETGRRVLLPMVYFGYATFDEELEYEYPFGVPGATTYPPR